jgi:ATP-dependent exoDNAse (exonuclease V) alpha subunit
MAQYHFAATIVCRSKGQSAVAAAAYRAGACLDDERLGKTFDYTRRHGVLHTEIRTAANAPDWMRDRGTLWNAGEKAERRKDSQVARSLDIALPHELTLDQNVELVRGFVDDQYVRRGMIADFAIHAPARKGDIRNIHVHILLTTRQIEGSGFGPKARDWNRKQELEGWREAWAEHANRILERGGFEERIDHRSLKDQGIDREATTHVGPGGKQIEERGNHSDRAQMNRDIKADNDNLALVENEIAESEKRLGELRRQLAAERMEQIQKIVRAADAVWTKAEQQHPPEPDPPPAPEPPAPTKQPEPSSGSPRQPGPNRYADLIDRQKYAERANEDEEKQKADREREKDEDKERERKRDRER